MSIEESVFKRHFAKISSQHKLLFLMDRELKFRSGQWMKLAVISYEPDF